MTRRKKVLGKDAVVSVLAKYLHPSSLIREQYPNRVATLRIEGLVVIRQDSKVVTRRLQDVIVMKHEDFKENDEYIELHSLPRWLKVQQAPPQPFPEGAEAVEEQQEPEEPRELPSAVVAQIASAGVVNSDHILSLVASGVQVDDDNQPLEENIPQGGEDPSNVFADSWGHNGICHRRQAGGQNVRASLVNFPQNFIPTAVQLFEHLFPKSYLKDILIPSTSEAMENGEAPLTYGELLRFLGMWFEMATTHFENRRDFWSLKTVERHNGAPWRFNDDMSRSRFEKILNALTLTNVTPPSYRDPFWEIRQLVDCWNENMSRNFSPSWISVLDESMSKWLSEYTCPGFMCVPRKPWPLGNEWHSICCSESGVMYGVELMEGKDRPPARPMPLHSDKGKTVGLLLRLTKPLWYTSKTVILDSGFCVLKGIVEMRKLGVFGAALIKKDDTGRSIFGETTLHNTLKRRRLEMSTHGQVKWMV